jgi:hypothetical protein
MTKRTKLILAYPIMVLAAGVGTTLAALLDLGDVASWSVIAGVGALAMVGCLVWTEGLTPSRLREARRQGATGRP